MILLKSLSSLLLLICSLPIFSQQWIQTPGPQGGNGYAVVQSGGYLFAGLSPGGVYRSTNMGSSWVHSSSGFFSGDDYVQALYLFNNTLYAGTRSWLYNSTDNGSNWSRVSGFMGSEVTDIKSSGIYLYAVTFGGVSVSSDNGISWVLNNTGLTNLYANALVIKNNKLFLATEGGIFLSTDNGVNWTGISTGLTQLSINDITRKGNDIYAATAGGGLFKTTNDGVSWFNSGVGIIYPNVLSIIVHDSILFASDFSGIYSSTNNGLSWQTVSFLNGIPNNPTAFKLQTTGSILFACLLGDGVYGSTNSGNTWMSLNSGIIETSVFTLSSLNNILFAGSQKRIFSTSNNGVSWELSSNGLNCTYFTCMHTAAGIIYAGTGGGGCGIYRSTNNGTSWQNINSGLGNTFVNDITGSSGYIYTATNLGVYKSTNSGLSWSPASSGLSGDYVQMIKDFNGTLFAYTIEGLFRSTNNGQLWVPSGSGFPQYTLIDDMALHNGMYYAAASNGVYFSPNGGISWSLRFNSWANTILSIDSVLIISSGNQLRYSVNNGISWQTFNSGFNEECLSLFAADSSIFAGTASGGVYKFEKRLISASYIGEIIPSAIELYGNYPNPFNPSTTIRFLLPEKTQLSLQIHDSKGSLVAELFNGSLNAGTHEFKWDALNFSSGIYFYTLKADKFISSKKMILLK